MKHYTSKSIRRNLGRMVRVLSRIKGPEKMTVLRGESRLRANLERAVGAHLSTAPDKETALRMGFRLKVLDIHHDGLIVFERIGPAFGNLAAMRRLAQVMT